MSTMDFPIFSRRIIYSRIITYFVEKNPRKIKFAFLEVQLIYFISSFTLFYFISTDFEKLYINSSYRNL